MLHLPSSSRCARKVQRLIAPVPIFEGLQEEFVVGHTDLLAAHGANYLYSMVRFHPVIESGEVIHVNTSNVTTIRRFAP
jgi:hypothetical protein